MRVDAAGGSSRDPAGRTEGSLGHELYAQILGELMKGAIEPGARLSVDALARKYDVSQTPIRQALGRLEGDGLATRTHLRGFRAAPMLARQEFEHIFELRLVLEPFVARRAAMKASPDGVKALWDLQASMVDSLRSRSRADEFATEDACWHDKIAELSGNPIVRDTLTRTHAHLHIYRLRRESVLAERAAQEHREVIDAVARHDARLAERAMRSHVANSRDRLFASMS